MTFHYGAVEADFLRFYGLQLAEALWGTQRMGVRRLWALLQGLPADAATWASYEAARKEREKPKPVTASQATSFFPVGPPESRRKG